jgi:EmrB/QacA subfamily drug resistance transporter
MNSPAATESINRQPLLWLVALGFFMQTLDSTIVNTALPAMASSLGESPLRMQSVVVVYSLTMAMLIPASGWLADRFGTQRVFFSAILCFVIGSLCCAGSRTLTQLVASRVLQGAGGAMLLPVGRLAVLRSVTPQRFLEAMSFVAVPGLVGPLIGPTLGGWLVVAASWHWIFLINVPIGAIGCVATFFYMRNEIGPDRSPFDYVGYLMLSIGMVAISVALDGLSGFGIKHASMFVLLIFGLASLVAYWLHASQRAYPLFATSLFKVPTFSIGLLGNLFARLGSGSIPFLIPLTLQVGLGHTPVQAGVMMLPISISALITKRVVTPLILYFGYKRVLTINTLLVGLSITSFAFIAPAQPAWVRVIQLVIFGFFNSLQFTAMNTVVLKDLTPAQASSGNTLLSMVQMLAMGFGVAVAGTLINIFTDLDAKVRASALEAFHSTFICVGLITCASAWIFAQLSKDVQCGNEKEPAELSS